MRLDDRNAIENIYFANVKMAVLNSRTSAAKSASWIWYLKEGARQNADHKCRKRLNAPVASISTPLRPPPPCRTVLKFHRLGSYLIKDGRIARLCGGDRRANAAVFQRRVGAFWRDQEGLGHGRTAGRQGERTRGHLHRAQGRTPPSRIVHLHIDVAAFAGRPFQLSIVAQARTKKTTGRTTGVQLAAWGSNSLHFRALSILRGLARASCRPSSAAETAILTDYLDLSWLDKKVINLKLEQWEWVGPQHVSRRRTPSSH